MDSPIANYSTTLDEVGTFLKGQVESVTLLGWVQEHEGLKPNDDWYSYQQNLHFIYILMFSKLINLLIVGVGLFLIRQAYILLLIPSHIHTFVTVFYPCNLINYLRSIHILILNLDWASSSLNPSISSSHNNRSRNFSYSSENHTTCTPLSVFIAHGKNRSYETEYDDHPPSLHRNRSITLFNALPKRKMIILYSIYQSLL